MRERENDEQTSACWFAPQMSCLVSEALGELHQQGRSRHRIALQATAVLAEPRCWLGKTPHSFLKLLYFKGSYRERQRERLVSIPTGQNEAASQEPGVHLGAGVRGRERRGLSETLKYNLGPRAHQYSRGSWENRSVTGRLTRLIPCPTNFWNRNWIPCKASDLMVCCLFINISSLTYLYRGNVMG